MSKFGWSLPPGVSQRMIDDAAGVEGPCMVCGKAIDNCICPTCDKCDEVGNPVCYKEHGLVCSAEQINSLATAEARWKSDADWITSCLLPEGCN